MPTWPTSLPSYFLTDGYSQSLPDGRIRSQTDIGPAKVRTRSTAVAVPLVGRMLMTGTQIGILETFCRVDLLNSTGVFDFTDPVTRTSIKVRFSESVPAWTHVSGNYFSVQLQLEKLP